MRGSWTLIALLCAVASSSTAMPVIDIRASDSNGGPEMRIKMLAVPILQEILVPDATVFFSPLQQMPPQPQPTYYLQKPICGNQVPPSQPMEMESEKTDGSGGGGGAANGTERDLAAPNGVAVFV